jgi:hypothetical protein
MRSLPSKPLRTGAEQLIVAAAAKQFVESGGTEQLIVATAANELNIPATTPQDIVPATPENRPEVPLMRLSFRFPVLFAMAEPFADCPEIRAKFSTLGAPN